MTTQLVREPRLAEQGNRQTVRSGDLNDGETLRAGNRITVFRTEVASDKVAWWGHGGRPGQPGRTSYTKGDLVASGNGTGTDGDNIEAEVHVAFTDSDGDPIARRVYADADSLREAIAEARTDRPAMPAMATENGNVAADGRFLEIQLQAKPASDGVELDPADSTLKMFYTTN